MIRLQRVERQAPESQADNARVDIALTNGRRLAIQASHLATLLAVLASRREALPCHRPDTGNGFHPLADLIMGGGALDPTVQFRKLPILRPCLLLRNR